MLKRGLPGLASGDGNSHSPLSFGHKRVTQELLSNGSLSNYAKQTPADANGMGNAAQTILSMGRSR